MYWSLPKFHPLVTADGLFGCAVSTLCKADKLPVGDDVPATPPVSARFGILLVIAAAAMWATVGVAIKLVPAAALLPNEAFGLARTAIAGLLIMAVAGLFRPKGQVAYGPFRVASLLQFAVSGALFQIGLFRCFGLLGVTATVFVTVCLPPVIALVWTLLRGQAQILLPPWVH